MSSMTRTTKYVYRSSGGVGGNVEMEYGTDLGAFTRLEVSPAAAADAETVFRCKKGTSTRATLGDTISSPATHVDTHASSLSSAENSFHRLPSPSREHLSLSLIRRRLSPFASSRCNDPYTPGHEQRVDSKTSEVMHAIERSLAGRQPLLTLARFHSPAT